MAFNPWEEDDEPDTTCIDCGEEGWKEIERIARAGQRERVWLCASCYQLSNLDDPTEDDAPVRMTLAEAMTEVVQRESWRVAYETRQLARRAR